MKSTLEIVVGSVTHKGNKPVNQDAVISVIPTDQTLLSKGAVFAVADGISTSEVSDEASRVAVHALGSDYYSTPEAWSTKNSGVKVIAATNAWLHAQSMKTESRFDLNTGYVCTLSALVVKSHTAYLFHCGDSRIYHLSTNDSIGKKSLTQLTEDHRTYQATQSYLANAMGLHSQLHLDYHEQSVSIGDQFLLASDGVFEFVEESEIVRLMGECDAQDCAEQMVKMALRNGSDDNLSAVVVKVTNLPSASYHELQMQGLATPKHASVGEVIDGFQLLRELYIGSRSHIYLASRSDATTKQLYAFKVLSTELSNDKQAKEAMLMEEWVGQRIHNAHLLAFPKVVQSKSSLYVVSDFVEGTTLEQWMLDNPTPSLDSVRTVVAQIARGLQAMHRQEMVHQDLRPANIIIDESGTAVVIDFGATRVAGLSETDARPPQILGTAQYSAPEYFWGDIGTGQSDQFSLAVITYQMLTGKLPYGTSISKNHTLKQMQNLHYVPITSLRQEIPAWVDDCIRKALEIEPYKRYQEVSELVRELSSPRNKGLTQRTIPFIEKNPVLFWQRSCLVLFVLLMVAVWH